MKHILMILLLCMGNPGSAQSISEMLENPYWSIDTYVTAYCLFRDAFYADAKENEIDLPEHDLDIETWIRQDFDDWMKTYHVTLVGAPIEYDIYLCP